MCIRDSRLNDYRRALLAIEQGRPFDDPSLIPIFERLGRNMRAFKLPAGLFRDLLDAFSQDVGKTRYADFAELSDYCRRSANPVGRLLLCLYKADTPDNLAMSDQICTSLQPLSYTHLAVYKRQPIWFRRLSGRTRHASQQTG